MMSELKVPSFPHSPNYSFILPMEAGFDNRYRQEWMSRNWTISLYVGVAYVVAVFALKSWMVDRPPLKLRKFLVIWNTILSAFSFLAAFRTLPEFLFVLRHYGYHFSVCNRSYMETNLITAYWTWVFILSKIPELVDTAFVVLRKQPLIFLHWFHHFLTLVVSWFVYQNHPAMGRWVVNMNYSIHAVMYGYYALRAMGVHIPRWISMSITCSQIAQMFLGWAASAYSFAMILRGTPCDIDKEQAGAFFFLYGSFAVLFLNFFVQSYFFKTSKKHLKSR